MKLTKLLILCLFLSLKGFSQAPNFTLKYDKTEFCAGSKEIAKPQIFNPKGDLLLEDFRYEIATYTYSTISGNGKLTIEKNGKIDLSKSDIGKYILNFKYRGQVSQIIFNINKCN